MIAWMGYSIVVGSLLALAAACGESAMRTTGRAGRWPWVAAMAGTALLPALARLTPSVLERIVPQAGGFARLPPIATLVPIRWPDTAASGPLDAVPWDALAVGAWLLMSSVLAGSVAVAFWKLRKARATWTVERHGGIQVLVSAGTGPAALASGSPRIVLPRWALSFDAALVELLVAHESEHIRMRDPHLALAALAIVVLLPWNPAVWWQWKRLRGALEIDCDRRVLRSRPRVAEYGRLLLEVGERRAGRLAFAVGLGENRSTLERRVRAILQALPMPRPRRVAALSGASAVLLGLAVCTPDTAAPDLTAGENVATPAVAPDSIPQEPSYTPFDEMPEIVNRAEMQASLTRHNPLENLPSAQQATAYVWMYIDEDGNVLRTRIQRSSGDPEVDTAAQAVARDVRFEPARADGSPVAVWVSIPITFTPSR